MRPVGRFGHSADFAISIHAPLAGCDSPFWIAKKLQSKFQSTHPLRGATRRLKNEVGKSHISLHAPLAGCDNASRNLRKPIEISIHAPLAGCDAAGWGQADTASKFQSTHPLRGATQAAALIPLRRPKISIHAPLAGCDNVNGNDLRIIRISIHAPLAGCDSKNAQKIRAFLRKRYKHKCFACKKCTSGHLTAACSSKNARFSGANRLGNPCVLSVRTQRISGPSTSNPGLMPKCSILERYFSPR